MRKLKWNKVHFFDYLILDPYDLSQAFTNVVQNAFILHHFLFLLFQNFFFGKHYKNIYLVVFFTLSFNHEIGLKASSCFKNSVKTVKKGLFEHYENLDFFFFAFQDDTFFMNLKMYLWPTFFMHKRKGKS